MDFLSKLKLNEQLLQKIFTHHFQRSRKIDACTFLELLLEMCENQSEIDLEQIALKFYEKTEQTISKQAIFKKMNCVFEGIKKLFEALLERYFKHSQIDINHENFGFFNDIIIQDSTVLSLPKRLKNKFPHLGGSKNSEAAIKIHIAYSLVSHAVVAFEIGAGIEHDSKFSFLTNNVKENSLIIKDLAYFSKENLEQIDTHQNSFFISRLKHNKKIYIPTSKGLKDISIKNISKSKEVYCHLENDENSPLYRCCITYDDQSKPHYLIANLDFESLSSKQISFLYRLRWQIELLFKAIKQSLCLDQLKNKGFAYFQCILYAKLIIMIVRLHSYANLKMIMYLKYKRFLSIQSFFKRFIFLKINYFDLIFGEVFFDENMLEMICKISFFDKSKKSHEDLLLQEDLIILDSRYYQ
jgi:hypothetical protein